MNKNIIDNTAPYQFPINKPVALKPLKQISSYEFINSYLDTVRDQRNNATHTLFRSIQLIRLEKLLPSSIHKTPNSSSLHLHKISMGYNLLELHPRL